MENEKPFVDGMRFKKPHENAPDFIKGQISIKKDEFISWLTAQGDDEWINIDLKKSRQGNLYLQKNGWKKSESSEDENAQANKVDTAERVVDKDDEVDVKDIPF